MSKAVCASIRRPHPSKAQVIEMNTNPWLTTMRALLLGLTLAALAGGLASAQDVTGAVQGRCVSTDGEPEPGVLVTLSGTHLQGPRETETDRQGYFQFRAVPPGVYELQADRVGLQPVEVLGIVVELRRTTAIPDLTMTPKSIVMETVVVRPPEIAIDPADTAAGGVLDEEDYASLPVDRDYKSLITILPLANLSYRGDLVSVGGSTGLENQYFIDGVNVTDPKLADRGTSLPFNFVRAVEVQTAGYEAQFGRALGGVVNAVTYSGTNDFELQAFGFIEPSSLAMEPRDTAAIAKEEGPVSYDFGVRVGGPLLRDRLWYSAALNPRTTQVDMEIAGLGTYTDRTDTLRYAGKLTWQASSATNLELSVFGDPTERDQVVPDWIPPGTFTMTDPDPLLAQVESGGNVASLRATVVLSRSLLFETWISGQRDRYSSLPGTARGESEDFYWDEIEGSLGGGWGFASEEDRGRTSFTAKVTFSTSAHTLVGGVNYEDAKVNSSLDARYIRRWGDSSWIRGVEAYEGTFHNRSPVAYIQDNWRINNRFTLSPGLRWSAQYLIGASGRIAQQITDEWQPRLGVSWLLGTERRQRLFGSYGRFYQTIPTNIATLWFVDYVHLIGYYSSDPRDPDSVPDSVADWGKSETDFAQQIPGLQAENYDEFTLGYERLLGEHSKLTFRGIRRDLRSSFQWGRDTSTNEWVLGTPGTGDFSFLPPPEREYTALEISAMGTWSRARYRASYVLSRTEGNYPGLFNSDQGFANPGGNWLFFTPEQAENSTGYLPNDRTHVIKLSGDYATDFGFTAGAILLVESGAPINDWGPSPAMGTFAPVFLSSRGSAGRTESLWDLSLRLTYRLPIAKQRPLKLLLDVLHVGDPQREVWVDEVHYREIDADGNPTSPNPNYKQPVAYQPPMAARLGLMATF